MEEETKQQLIKQCEKDIEYYSQKIKDYTLEIDKAKLLLNILSQ